MLLISLLAGAAVFALIFGLFYEKAQVSGQISSRLKAIKKAQGEEPKKKAGLSLKEMRERSARKKRDKLLDRQISSVRQPNKQSSTDRMLQMADMTMTGIQFTLLEVGLGAGLGLLLMLGCTSFGLDSLYSTLAFCFGAISGLLLPKKFLESKVKKKQAMYRDALPDMMDLLVVSVEAGLGFDAAILRLYEKDKSPLMQEMMRAIQDVQHGMSKKEAYHNMAERCNVKELTSFLNALIQAEQLGISIKSVLKTQAESQREARRQRAEEKALKAPVTMLIPMVLLIFPVIFIILLGPAVMNIAEVF